MLKHLDEQIDILSKQVKIAKLQEELNQYERGCKVELMCKCKQCGNVYMDQFDGVYFKKL